MQNIRENEEKNDGFWKIKSPVKINENDGNRIEDNISNKNLIPSNRSSKVTTKVSKLIYDPQNQTTRAIIKSTNTYGNKLSSDQIKQSTFFKESPQLDNDKFKTSKFKARDINKFTENKLTDSPDNANPINKNNDFLKKKLEREKDIEDIQNMLNQINTSCHENNEESNCGKSKNTLKVINSITTEEDNLEFMETESNQILYNEPEMNIPINSQKESNLDINNTENVLDKDFNTNQSILDSFTELNPQNIKYNNSDELNSPSETDLNLRRSQTDMNLKTKFLLSPQKPISSRTGTVRSKSSMNLFSRNNSKVSLETATKKKSYVPNEARQFMKEQRLKRQQIKNEQKSLLPQNNGSNVDKVAIKKRLEDLRKCTLKILEKNVKVKEKQKMKNNDDPNLISIPNTMRTNKTILKQSNSKGTLKLEKPKKNVVANEKLGNRKIGLLRKPETEENSFSALKDFNINKENLNLNMKTPTVIETSENDQGFRKISDTVMFKKVPESIFENNIENITENNLELTIPSKELERKVSLREKSIQVDAQPSLTVKNTKPNELPYWLKPTPVQCYPYNFIMAVRKKLEAITNPVISDNNKYRKNLRKHHNEIKRTQETPLTYPKDRKEAVRRRIIDEKNFNLNVNDSTEQNIINDPNEKTKIVGNEKDNCGHSSKSISEITSNFSSISIHVPESHTISDYSSIRSDAASNQKSLKHLLDSTNHKNNKVLTTLNFIHEDDTTISSSVFSSPEKKFKKQPGELNKNIKSAGPLSPLSVDNINKLQIKSKSNLDKVNLERGTDNYFEKPQIQLTCREQFEVKIQKKDPSIGKSNSSRTSLKSENLDFSQLLEDFNKSLSQVIEVNQQLKETLKKSNQILSPKRENIQKIVKEKSVAPNEILGYNSDFEKEIQKLNSDKPLDQHHRNKNMKIIPASSIQSKTEEYTSDFEEEPSSIEYVENVKSTTLNITQPKINLITESCSENLQSTLSNSKITEKFDENVNNSQIEEIVTNQSQIINTTQEFLDSIEEISKIKTSSISEHITESTNNKIIENVIIEEEENSNQKSNQSLNKFSKDSLDHLDNSVSQSKNEFINNHVNNSRGDFNVKKQNDELKSNSPTQAIESKTGPPPAYIMSENNLTKEETTNSSICSEFIAVFNRSDIALSIYSENESSVSEATLNYSTIGMYEKLLQTETSKSDQLATLLKMREKALMDRTKGQIAWLEVQKEKYKSKGLSVQISHIKKKQRAILMKMEKEREEIKKIIERQQPQVSARTVISDRQRSYRPKIAENISDISIRNNFSKNSNRNNTITTSNTIKSSNKIIRGVEIQSCPNLEIILQKREEELRKRRAHVECLMEWHQRLDKEEEEVFQLERILFEHNAAPQKHHEEQSKHHSDLYAQNKSTKELDILKREKKIFEINKSLRELQNISSRSTDSTGNQNSDYVRTTGNKLNKLWRRLTGQKHIEKFEVNKKYKLYKNDLEKLYEEAKEKVLREFGNQNEMMELFEQSKCLETTATSLESQSQIIVPRLNLNFSSGQSDIEHTNCSSVFYESTIQKQFQSTNLLENIDEYSISKSTNLTNEILSSEINQKSKQLTKTEISDKIEIFNLEISQNEKVLDINNELFNEKLEENSKLEINLIPAYPIELDSVTTNTPEKINSNIENNSSNSEMQITKITDISDIIENKTSDDITSLSSEEQNKSFEKSVIDSNSLEILKLNLSPEKVSAASTNVENSEQNSVANEINSLNFLNEYVERASVIITPILTKETNSQNANTTKILLESESTLQSANPSQIEEIVKFSEDRNSDICKLSEDAAKSCELIIETSNLEKPDTKIDCSGTLEKCYTKSDSIKSEIDFSRNELTEKDNIVSPEKSISEYFESPKILDNSKQFSESPQYNSDETFVLTEQNITNSSITINSPILTVSQIETQKTIEETEEYENDFSGDMTFLEDITEPKFELTMEDSKSIFEDSNLKENESTDEKIVSTTELEKRLIDLDVSLKDLHNTFDRALSPDKNSITPPPPPLLSPPLITLSNISSPDDTTIKLDLEKYSLPPRNYITNNENATSLMPDIINEVEIRRRQQILIESEIKQLEQTVPPYVFLREIPNKPPPPYVPPAHGSPMTIIFPSEQRIKEITFRRTKELYDEILKTDKNDDNINFSLITLTTKYILDENITNIYERIILDICKECMEEYKEILTNLNPQTYKNSLALFNPPNRLKCMQEFVYRHVRKLLSMEKKSNILQKNSVISIGRKKRDHVDEILIQELYDDEHKWTNFDQEEEEVKLAIVDEILNDIVKDVIGEVTDMNEKKLEFLTNYSSVNLNND